jgi:hypothetical protein
MCALSSELEKAQTLVLEYLLTQRFSRAFENRPSHFSTVGSSEKQDFSVDFALEYYWLFLTAALSIDLAFSSGLCH